jgi:hypothetical protein
MGACSIVVTASGKNMDDAFKNAQEEAAQEYGHQQGYSGAINCCELGRDVTRLRNDYDEEDHFQEWILNNTSKRLVYGYCTQDPIPNKNKTKSEVKNIPQKGTRKWETRYIAEPDWTGQTMSQHISEKTQGAAIKAARAYTEKNPGVVLKVKVTKILVEGGETCAEVRYKKSSTERDGRYTFVGYAPE